MAIVGPSKARSRSSCCSCLQHGVFFAADVIFFVANSESPAHPVHARHNDRERSQSFAAGRSANFRVSLVATANLVCLAAVSPEKMEVVSIDHKRASFDTFQPRALRRSSSSSDLVRDPILLSIETLTWQKESLVLGPVAICLFC